VRFAARLLRFCLPPAFAAFVLASVEILRTWLFGAVTLGGAGQGLALGLCILGLLGAPLLLGGFVVTGTRALVAAGWRWGRADAPEVAPARRAAWAIHGALTLAVSVVAVQSAVVAFVQTMRKPVYQGLAAGLVGALALLVMLALAGPLVGVWARLLERLRRVLPRPLDPTSASGAGLWVVGASVLGGLLAPVLLVELRSVDLRPAWMGLLYAVLLGVAFKGASWLCDRMPRFATGALLAAMLLPTLGLGFAARSVGGRQTRLLALDRDTVVTGPLFRRLRALADRDGDGVPALFGGGDCDDADPNVRPGGYDTPDNRVDENCTGADLRLGADPLAAPRRSEPAGPVQPFNVLFVTLDAVRDDFARRFMPNLQQLAAEGVDFRNAYSQGAATYWSIPALMASNVPSRIEYGPDQTPVEKELLLAEVLRDAGWQTALYANVTIFFVRGLKQGTEYQNYETSDFTKHGETPGAEHLTRGMLGWVDRWMAKPTKDRFFLWGHYYDPHDPYGEVPGHPARDASDEALYEANLAYVDDHLGQLIAGLKTRGLWEKTIVVVTADHGDEFLDHGHRFHGATLYEEMTHVPLVMRVPGLPARVVDVPAAHMDVGPTLLDLLNVKIPARFLGHSRAAELRTGVAPEPYPVYSEVLPDSNYGSHQVSLVLGRTKLIDRINEGYAEFYRLDDDPGERVNRFDDAPEVAELATRLGEYIDHHLYWLAQGRTGARVPPGRKPPATRR
jgi:arylsulfatase A-like enzyme